MKTETIKTEAAPVQVGYTPGPWKIENGVLCNMEIVKHIADISFGLDGEDETEREAAEYAARHAANRALICAAPALLKVVEHYLAEWNDTLADDFKDSLLESLAIEARAALALAKGAA